MPEVTVLSPLGAVVRGVAVDTLDDATTNFLRDLLAAHGVIVLPGQRAGNAEFIRFLWSFGPMTFTTGETPVPGFPDLNVITNVGRSAPPTSNFHVDTSYVREPPAYTALRAVELPASGGQTLFTNQYAAYDTLPDALRTEIAGRVITHIATGVELGEDDEKSADHPIAAPHPRSGRMALYVSTPKRCAAVSGLPAPQAAELVAELLRHSTREDNVLRHPWSPGDVVMWDNRCVLHRADHDGVVGARVMHRGMVRDVG